MKKHMGGRVVHRHTVPDGGGGTVVPLCPHVPVSHLISELQLGGNEHPMLGCTQQSGQHGTLPSSNTAGLHQVPKHNAL